MASAVASWATGLVSRLVGWCLGLVSRAARWTAHQVRLFLEPLLAPLRLFYDYVKTRIGTWILGLALVITYCLVAAAVAVVVYLFLYHNFVPIIAFHKPVFFDFTRTEPWAVADFANKWSPSGQERQPGASGGPLVVATPVLSPGHLYDFSLDLVLPEVPINDQIGMFMVTLSLHSWDGHLLANSSRPCRLRYKTDLLQKISTLFWSVPLVLGLMEEKQALRLELLPEFVDTHTTPFGYATLTLSHRELQVYSAHLHIEARLSGISYFCYYWFFTAMGVFVPLIFLAETWLVILTWLVIYFLLPAATAAATSPGGSGVSSLGGGGGGSATVPAPVLPPPAAPALQPASVVAPVLEGLEELGREAHSPVLPGDRQPQIAVQEGEHVDDSEKPARLRAEREEEDVALQKLLEDEIARKLARDQRRAPSAYGEEEDLPSASEEADESDADEGDDEEDTGAGVYPRLRRRRPPHPKDEETDEEVEPSLLDSTPPEEGEGVEGEDKPKVE